MMHKKEEGCTRREFIKKTSSIVAGATIVGTVSGLASGCDNQRRNEAAYDVVIKNGTVYDGTLAVPLVADVGIKGNRIVEIGKIPEANGYHVVDAAGLAVTPGFIDIHTHCDMTFKRIGIKRFAAYVIPSFKGNHNYLYQGVTTVVTGNCGYGYTDTQYWMDLVNAVGFGTNVYHLAPHGMIRVELFGENQPRELTQKQLDAMKHRVAEEMEKGAIGFSTGLEYAPGLLSSTKELIELNKVVRKYGRIHTTHLRDQTGSAHPSGKPGIEVALEEAFEIGRRAEIPIQVSHLTIKAPFNQAKASKILDMFEQARHEGIDVTADQFPYASGQTFLSARLPNKFKSANGVKEKYKTKEGRRQIKAAIEHRFTYSGPEKVMIALYPQNKSYERKTLVEIAEIAGKSPADCYVDMVCEPTAPLAIFFDYIQNNVNEIMSKADIITASDGLTVPGKFVKLYPACYGTFPKRYRECVINRKEMSVAAAIRTMTSLPAEKFNMKERGKIAKGYYADIAVINLNTFRALSTYKNPSQYSEGIQHLFVNGTQSIENGEATHKRSGRGLIMA